MASAAKEPLLGYHPYRTGFLTMDRETGPGTMSAGEFDWGGRLRKGIGGARRFYEDLLDMTYEETYLRASWILAGNGRDEKLADIGNTYIVIDISTQSLLYVIDGEIFLEDTVVTGRDSVESRRTPEGVFCVWGKQTEVDLIGEDWNSHVAYWMPFTYVGEGLHDAPWRSEAEFGGTTYINSGSHGCVNLRPETAKLLFETIEIGTPVLIYKSIPDEAEGSSGT